MHARLSQTGTVMPCCRAALGFEYGDLRNEKLEDVMNGEKARELRRALMLDQAHPACADCHNVEKLGSTSLRNEANRDFSDLFELVDETAEDGRIENVKMRFLDLRFSNLCNFRCRTCNHHSSTAWAAEMGSSLSEFDREIKRPTKSREELWSLLEDAIPLLRRVYFAGGEPLLDEDHYGFLDRLINAGRTDVELIYNTNFSKLRFQDRDVLKLWSQFSNVKVYASFDGVGAKGELIRKGMTWNRMIENFRSLSHGAPHVVFIVNPTICVLNAFHITDAIAEWMELGMVTKAKSLKFNFLTEPRYLSVDILSAEERERLREHYKTFLSGLARTTSETLLLKIAFELRSVIQSLAEEPVGARQEFREFTHSLDKLRGESFVQAFPEYQELFSE